jgi:integrase
LECTGKKSARKTDDYESRHYEKGADEEHHHLTRYRRQNGVIKDAILASNPIAIFASGLHDGGPVAETLGAPPSSNKPKLLEQVREVIRRKHYSIRTEQAYCDWIKRFILFHRKRHPAEMAEAEITAFLTYLAANVNVAPSTQNQALSALLFLYRDVLQQKIGWLDNVERAKKPARLPVVLTRSEARRIFSHLHGTMKLMAGLLYGSGLRLMECVRLRVKDVDLGYLTITVRESKAEKTASPCCQQILPKLCSGICSSDTRNMNWIRPRTPAARACAEVSRCKSTVDVAIRVRLSAAFDRSPLRRKAASSHRRECPSARSEGSDKGSRNRQAGNMSHASTQFRHTPFGKRLRYSHGPRAVRSFTP